MGEEEERLGEEGDILSVFGRIFEMASGWFFPAFSREDSWERREKRVEMGEGMRERRGKIKICIWEK